MRSFIGLGALAILAVAAGFAQSAQPRFDVATVKPTPEGVVISSMTGGPLPQGPFNQEFLAKAAHNPSRITWTNVRLKRMIQVAYDYPADRISGPDWLDTVGFTTVATIPGGASVEDFRLMLRNLLADRFKLVVHRGTKDISGLILELAKNGPKLGAALTRSATAAAPNIVDQRPGARYDEAMKYMATPHPGIPIHGRDRPERLRHACPWKCRVSARSRIPSHHQRQWKPSLNGLEHTYVRHRHVSREPGRVARGRSYRPQPEITISTLRYRTRPSAATDAASEPGPDVLDAVQTQLRAEVDHPQSPGGNSGRRSRGTNSR